jgi:hypothetical protein
MDPSKTSNPNLYSITPAMYMAIFRLSDRLYSSQVLEIELKALAAGWPPEGMYICHAFDREGINAIAKSRRRKKLFLGS